MPIDLKMPALSPTMEEGTLAKWLVKAGDTVKAGDVLAEIETDKATMEFEAVDEGIVAAILVPEGSDGVKVGTVIATIAEEGEDPAAAAAAPPKAAAPKPAAAPAPSATPAAPAAEPAAPPAPHAAPAASGSRVKASPLARKVAAQKGVALDGLSGTGPGGRIVRADVERAPASAVASAPASAPAAPVATAPAPTSDIPHEITKLSNMRKTIARRLTEAKSTIPHIYLTVDIRLDALLALRADLNKTLEARGVKLSVNDMLVKALALALIEVPSCNVSFAGDTLIEYRRADIAVAVSIPNGLITPIVTGANEKPLSTIATEIGALAARAKEGKLQPHEYQGGTASISNMGMMGIREFAAVINPPQAMILAVGAGEKRAIVDGDTVTVATMMIVTGSFDHRAIDGADGAALMGALKRLVEAPLELVA